MSTTNKNISKKKRTPKKTVSSFENTIKSVAENGEWLAGQLRRLGLDEDHIEELGFAFGRMCAFRPVDQHKKTALQIITAVKEDIKEKADEEKNKKKA